MYTDSLPSLGAVPAAHDTSAHVFQSISLKTAFLSWHELELPWPQASPSVPHHSLRNCPCRPNSLPQKHRSVDCNAMRDQPAQRPSHVATVAISMLKRAPVRSRPSVSDSRSSKQPT
jgi:hypothetical protein